MKHLCKNCIHAMPNLAFSTQQTRWRFGRCRATLVESPIDPLLNHYSYLDNERSSLGKCGPEGKNFELKEEEIQQALTEHFTCDECGLVDPDLVTCDVDGFRLCEKCKESLEQDYKRDQQDLQRYR